MTTTQQADIQRQITLLNSLTPIPAKTRHRDYVTIGIALSIPAFFGTALLMTVLGIAFLSKVMPDYVVFILGAILSIGAGWGTLEHFFRRDLKQYRR